MIGLLKKSAFNVLYYLFEKKQLSKIKDIKNHDTLYVIDIDNTLTISKLNDSINHKNPTPRLELISYLLSQDKNMPMIFLSARDFRLFNDTFKWLEKYQLIQHPNQLFLVKKAKYKIKYLNILVANQNKQIIYIDDLSFNHENGEVKHYEAIINSIRELPIIYHGVEFINRYS